MNLKKTILIVCALALVALAVFAQAKAPAYGKFSGKVSGSAKGFGGDVTVELTLKNGLITKADIKGPLETKEIGGKVITDAQKAIVARNSSEIDVVTGATLTSQAIITAGTNALAKAK
jgi:fumarate reductase flavoprotein subunit